MLKLAPVDCWIECTFTEAVIYCQFLYADGCRDWRLPTEHEAQEHLGNMGSIWHAGDIKFMDDDFICTIIPVRDNDVLEFAPPSPPLTYNNALLYCAFCRHQGYTDWRMPTPIELINHHKGGQSWYVCDDRSISTRTMSVHPVRG